MTSKQMPPLVQIDSASGLAEALATHIADKLSRAIDATGVASLVVSGGSTPKPLFEALRKHDIQWNKVTVTLADERWVPETDADSNAAFVKTTLLQGAAASATFVSLYEEGETPQSGVSKVDQRLKTVAKPFTVVVLGMGGDGHTASLFPGAPGTEAAMAERKALVSIVEPTTVPQARITLTLDALNNTECQLLHITGAEKRALVDEVLLDPASSPYPIAKFLRADNQRISVYSTH